MYGSYGPVSGIGGGVFNLDILMKPANCTDFRSWQEIYCQESFNFEANLEHIITFL